MPDHITLSLRPFVVGTQIRAQPFNVAIFVFDVPQKVVGWSRICVTAQTNI
jgi:hypothetical protein